MKFNYKYRDPSDRTLIAGFKREFPILAKFSMDARKVLGILFPKPERDFLPTMKMFENYHRNRKPLGKRLRGLASELEKIIPVFSDYDAALKKECFGDPNADPFGIKENLPRLPYLIRDMRELASYMAPLPTDGDIKKTLWDSVCDDSLPRRGRPKSTGGRDGMIASLVIYFLHHGTKDPRYSVVADMMNWAHGCELIDDDIKKAVRRGFAVRDYYEQLI